MLKFCRKLVNGQLSAGHWPDLGAALTATRTFATADEARLKNEPGSDPEDASWYSAEKETHFGFENVSEAQKAVKVKTVFENVANKYDLMNDFMSGGIHRVWKDIFVYRINPGPNCKIIDVAGGTGDIAFRFLKYQSPVVSDKIQSRVSRSETRRRPAEPPKEESSSESSLRGPSVLVSDINPKMLEVGRKRAPGILKPHELKRIDWLEADAENLGSIPDNTFDVYTIAFGIRNCVHVDQVVQEAYRILKPGGRFACLEFSQVPNSLIRWVYDQYSFQVIPALGQVVAGDWESYQYLVESIRKFPPQEEFKAIIQDAGFRFVSYENLTFGVVAIHSGYKL